MINVRKHFFIFTFHGFAVVRQRVPVTFKPHQSSKHLSIHNVLSEATQVKQRKSDPGPTWTHIDHVSEEGEAEPGSGTELISVVEK